jgi:hypothetical protein
MKKQNKKISKKKRYLLLIPCILLLAVSFVWYVKFKDKPQLFIIGSNNKVEVPLINSGGYNVDIISNQDSCELKFGIRNKRNVSSWWYSSLNKQWHKLNDMKNKTLYHLPLTPDFIVHKYVSTNENKEKELLCSVSESKIEHYLFDFETEKTKHFKPELHISVFKGTLEQYFKFKTEQHGTFSNYMQKENKYFVVIMENDNTSKIFNSNEFLKERNQYK